MNIIDSLWYYIDKYYLSGIINDTSYNLVDTLTYALVLGLSLFGVLKLLEKFNVKVDGKFIASVTPYILAGSSLRVLEDQEVFTPPLKYLFTTPLIYFFIFAVTVSVLAVALFLEQKGKVRDYHLFLGLTGMIWFIMNISGLLIYGRIENPYPAAAIMILGMSLTGIVYFISYQMDFELLTDKINISILFAHLLDASSTFIGMDWLDYYEKHVAPTFFIDIANKYTVHPAIVMFPLKLLVFIPVIYMLDNKLEDEKEKKFIGILKLALLVLGLSPAVRNTLRILMGV